MSWKETYKPVKECGSKLLNSILLSLAYFQEVLSYAAFTWRSNLLSSIQNAKI